MVEERQKASTDDPEPWLMLPSCSCVWRMPVAGVPTCPEVAGLDSSRQGGEPGERTHQQTRRSVL